jgi:RNA polymerase sigma factor (sigma-70 family)
MIQSLEPQWSTWLKTGNDGDERAYLCFLQSITPYLRGFLRKRCTQFSIVVEVEDILQETLLAVHLKRETWDRNKLVGPWLSAIARNKLTDTLRRCGRRLEIPLDDVIDYLIAEECVVDTESHTVEILMRSLTSRQQELVHALSLEGKSVRETAESLNMNEGAVRVGFHRSLKTMAALYRKGPA